MAVVFMTDENLVKALKSGEDLAFEVLIDKYGDKLMRLCYLILKDLAEAEDTVQEVFIQRGRIKDIVFSLPEAYREVIVLFYYEEMSLKEICTILDENENTVKSKLHRGRNKIKRKLIEEGLAYEER